VEFWQTKFAGTVERDARQRAALLGDGWRVATVWECALREQGADDVARKLADWLLGECTELEIGTPSQQRVHAPSASGEVMERAKGSESVNTPQVADGSGRLRWG
jgi:hypothetical protein